MNNRRLVKRKQIMEVEAMEGKENEQEGRGKKNRGEGNKSSDAGLHVQKR